jgi:hypothetical protein
MFNSDYVIQPLIVKILQKVFVFQRNTDYYVQNLTKKTETENNRAAINDLKDGTS